jgi:outer membrane protein assembly factor BamB
VPTVIEVDVAATWEPPAPPVRLPRLRRWLVAPLVLVAVLALVAGAVPRRPLAPAFTLDGAVLDLLARGDTLYLARYADPRGTLVEAYRFPDGALLWSRVFAGGAGLVHASARRLTVADGEGTGAGPVLTGLDATSGRIVWSRSGYERIAATDAVVLGAPPEPRSGAIRRMVAFASDDGVVRWSGELPPGTTTGYPPDIAFQPAPHSGAAVVLPDGTVQVRDVDSGELRWNVRVDFTGPLRGVLVLDDVAILYPPWRGEPDSATPVAVDLRTGRVLWRAERTARLGPCAGALCDLAASGTRALDPRTGLTRWQESGWHLAGTLDERHIVLVAGGPVDALAAAPAAVLDARTGRRVRELGPWRVLGSARGVAVVQRLDSTGTSVIARVDVLTGTRTVVGLQDSWIPSPRCRSTAVFVACAGTARVSVWSSWR